MIAKILSVNNHPCAIISAMVHRAWLFAAGVLQSLAVLGLVGLAASAALAQDYTYCTSCSPPYLPPSLWQILNGGTPYVQSSGGDCPWYHLTSTMVPGQGWAIIHSQGAVMGAVYEVDIIQPASLVSEDIIFALGSTNCDIGGGTATTAFQAAHSTNKWAFVCYLTNRVGVTKPEIEFRYLSGANNRTYIDCIRFQQISSPCAAVSAVVIRGPVATNIACVGVTGVNPSALAVIVYQKVGSTEDVIGMMSPPFDSNCVPVTWDATSLGAQVVATQIDPNGVESCKNWPGYVVGGGANPRIRVFLNCKTAPNGGNNGPVGAPCDSTGPPGLFFMPGVAGATVPAGGIVVQPSTNWQTVVIDPRTATKSYIWSGTGSGRSVINTDHLSQWCGLEGIDFQMDDTTDTGPFDILIDNIYSGPDLLVNFETDWAGATYDASTGAVSQVFHHPAYSGFPVGQFAGPESFFVVSNSYALSGTNVGEWKWQFSGGSSGLWVRNLMSNGPNWNYPQIRMTEPFQFDLLLLPRGATQVRGVGTAPPIASQTNCLGGCFTVVANITPPPGATPTYTYQWKFNGANIANATSSSYSKDPLLHTDAGTYSVVIGDGTGNTLTRYMVLTVPTPVTLSNLIGTILSYGGGGGTGFVLLKSSNLAAPLSSWSRIATNNATPGTFTVPTGSEDTAFYRIESE